MRGLWAEIGRHVLLAIGALYMLGPVVLMVLSSFTPTRDILAGNYLAHPTLENYATVARAVPLGSYYLHSVLVCLITLALQLLVCVPAAYALARLRFRGRTLSVVLVGALMLIPFQVVAIPIYLVFRVLGLVNSLGALVLPFVGSAFAIFLLRQFFGALPSSMFEAARLDGAGTVATLLQLVVPSSRPALLSLAIFAVTSAWNAYFWPSFVLTDQSAATIPFGVIAFQNSSTGTDYGPQMAMATLSVLPLLIAFLFAQKQFIRGLALTGQTG
jgi:multiple sugar transport system permease protein